MKKHSNPMASCRGCGVACRGKHEICRRCKDDMNRTAHILDLIRRYPDVIEKPDETNHYE